MKFIVVHVNDFFKDRPHLCSVHTLQCPKVKQKSKLPGYFTKEFGEPHGLRDAWNYIKDNGWDSELCSCVWAHDKN